MDTGTEDKVHNGLSVVENGYYVEAGEVRKRKGFTSIDTLTKSNPRNLFVTNKGLYYRTKDSIGILDGSGSEFEIDSYHAVSASKFSQHSNGQSIVVGDISADAEYVYVAMVINDTDTVVKVIDADTGNVIGDNTDVGVSGGSGQNAHPPKLVKIGSTVYCIFEDGSFGLDCYSLSGTSGTSIGGGPNAGVIAFDADTDGTYFVIAYTNGSFVYINYRDTSTFALVNSASLAVNETSVTPTDFSLAVSPTNKYIVVGWSENKGAAGAKHELRWLTTGATGIGPWSSSKSAWDYSHSETAADYSGDKNSRTAVGWIDDTNSVSVFSAENNGSSRAGGCKKVVWDNTGTSVGFTYGAPGYSPIAKPFSYDSKIYFLMADVDPKLYPTGNKSRNLNKTAVLFDEDLLPVGVLAIGTENGNLIAKNPGNYTKLYASGDSYRVPIVEKSGPDEDLFITQIYSADTVKILDVDMDPDVKTVDLGGYGYVSGSMIGLVDADTFRECGFIAAPQNVLWDISSTSGSGSLTVDASYSYRGVWEYWLSGGGRLQSYSIPETIDLGSSDDTVTITKESGSGYEYSQVMATRLGNSKFTTLAFWRTIGNPPPGALYYRASSKDQTTTGNNSWVGLKTADNEYSWDDYADDTNISDEEVQYESSGELSNVFPVSAKVMGEAKGRLWLSGGGDSVKYSKLASQGEAHQFADELFLTVGSREDVTAIDQLGEMTVVFKESSIYVIHGDGPDNTGANGSFSEPDLISPDVGCVDQRTVARIPDGLIFQSSKGFYVLRTNLQMQYVGDKVRDYEGNAYNSAVILKDENMVFFLRNQADGDDESLVYNWEYDTWSVWTLGGVSACFWDGALCVLRTDGSVWKQDASTFEDAPCVCSGPTVRCGNRTPPPSRMPARTTISRC
jgi:hypothetical protein